MSAPRLRRACADRRVLPLCSRALACRCGSLRPHGTARARSWPCGADQRDFAARTYDLPVRLVVQPPGEPLDPRMMTSAWEGPGTLVGSGPTLPSEEAKERITAALAARGLGEERVTYRLRDWGVSRQRAWGTPIPVVYCDRDGTVPVPESELPVTLPDDLVFTGRGGSPLAAHAAFVHARCPRCDGPARRETDTMDTFVQSSWYFARYCSPRSDGMPFDPVEVDYWLGQLAWTSTSAASSTPCSTCCTRGSSPRCSAISASSASASRSAAC